MILANAGKPSNPVFENYMPHPKNPAARFELRLVLTATGIILAFHNQSNPTPSSLGAFYGALVLIGHNDCCV